MDLTMGKFSLPSVIMKIIPWAIHTKFICDKITYSYLKFHELKAIAIYVKFNASAIKA